MKQRLLTLIKREYFAYVNSSLAYVIIVPILVLLSFLYFRDVLVLGNASLRPFVDLLPWFLIVMAPALVMRVFSEEYRKDTLELLYAHPISEWVIVLGKYLGGLLFYITFLATTLGLPLVIVVFSTPDYGLIIAQYLGALLLGGAFLAVGLASSAYVRSSVGSFLVGAAVSFGLLLLSMNFVLLLLPGAVARVVGELGVLSHLDSFSRGLVDLRDVLYFVTIIGLALLAAVVRLSARKLAEDAARKRMLVTGFGVLLAIFGVANALFVEFPVRLDLTRNQQFSLSAGTKQLLSTLPDRVTVTLVTSTNLPGPLQSTLQETSDRLKDFQQYSDKVRLQTVQISADGENRDEALERGIQEVQFNQIAQGSFQVQTGFLGLQVRYGGQTDTIPFIDDASNLEYELARMMHSLTRDEAPQIALLDATDGGALSELRQAMLEQYELVDYAQATEAGVLTGIVVVDDGSGNNATASGILSDYLTAGGNAVFFIDGVSVDSQILRATPSESRILTLLDELYSIKVNSDLVYDLQLHELIRMPAAATGQSYILGYPFWVKSIVQQAHLPWSSNAASVLMGWPSSLQLADEQQELVATSPNANTQTTNFTLSPDQLETLAPPSGESYSLGSLQILEGQHVGVFGDADMVTDEFLQNSPSNASFVRNMIDWVAADDILQSIPLRENSTNVFVFSSPLQLQLVQYGSILLPPLLVAGYGFIRLRRRRLLTKRVFIQ